MPNTMTDHLIAFLLSSRSTKIYRKILWSRLKARQKNSRIGAFDQNIYRLRRKGLVETRGGSVYVCRGELLRFMTKRNSVIKNIFPNKTEKVLISFDIPETKKKTRDWLRNQIKYWDFEMIHKSLWLGHGPLPREFSERLKQLSIDKYIRVFKVRKLS